MCTAPLTTKKNGNHYTAPTFVDHLALEVLRTGGGRRRKENNLLDVSLIRGLICLYIDVNPKTKRFKQPPIQ